MLQKYEQYSAADVKMYDSDYLQGYLKPSFYLETGIALRFRYDEEKSE